MEGSKVLLGVIALLSLLTPDQAHIIGNTRQPFVLSPASFSSSSSASAALARFPGYNFYRSRASSDDGRQLYYPGSWRSSLGSFGSGGWYPRVSGDDDKSSWRYPQFSNGDDGSSYWRYPKLNGDDKSSNWRYPKANDDDKSSYWRYPKLNGDDKSSKWRYPKLNGDDKSSAWNDEYSNNFVGNNIWGRYPKLSDDNDKSSPWQYPMRSYFGQFYPAQTGTSYPVQQNQYDSYAPDVSGLYDQAGATKEGHYSGVDTYLPTAPSGGSKDGWTFGGLDLGSVKRTDTNMGDSYGAFGLKKEHIENIPIDVVRQLSSQSVATMLRILRDEHVAPAQMMQLQAELVNLLGTSSGSGSSGYSGPEATGGYDGKGALDNYDQMGVALENLKLTPGDLQSLNPEDAYRLMGNFRSGQTDSQSKVNTNEAQYHGLRSPLPSQNELPAPTADFGLLGSDVGGPGVYGQGEYPQNLYTGPGAKDSWSGPDGLGPQGLDGHVDPGSFSDMALQYGILSGVLDSPKKLSEARQVEALLQQYPTLRFLTQKKGDSTPYYDLQNVQKAVHALGMVKAVVPDFGDVTDDEVIRLMINPGDSSMKIDDGRRDDLIKNFQMAYGVDPGPGGVSIPVEIGAGEPHKGDKQYDFDHLVAEFKNVERKLNLGGIVADPSLSRVSVAAPPTPATEEQLANQVHELQKAMTEEHNSYKLAAEPSAAHVHHAAEPVIPAANSDVLATVPITDPIGIIDPAQPELSPEVLKEAATSASLQDILKEFGIQDAKEQQELITQALMEVTQTLPVNEVANAYGPQALATDTVSNKEYMSPSNTEAEKVTDHAHMFPLDTANESPVSDVVLEATANESPVTTDVKETVANELPASY